MSATVLSRSAQPQLPRAQGSNLILAIVMIAWFALIVWLGATNRFVGAPGAPPFAIAIGFTAPIAVFFGLVWSSRAFREFVLAADLRLMVGIQAWRFAGLGFLALYTHNVLPGAFALPAGLGDIAIGATAPWILLALMRNSSFAASPAFTLWNVLGIADLLLAVGDGALSAALSTGAAGEISTGPMAQLPLVLIPVFLVPIFLMLHIASLMQARWAATELSARAKSP